MIRNYFTTVLLIWFHGGSDALLNSFNKLTRPSNVINRFLLYNVYFTSLHKGELYCKALH